MSGPYRQLFVDAGVPPRPIKCPVIGGLIERGADPSKIDFDAFCAHLMNESDVVEMVEWDSVLLMREHRMKLTRGDRYIAYTFTDVELHRSVHPFYAIIKRFFEMEWKLLDRDEQEALAKEWGKA